MRAGKLQLQCHQPWAAAANDLGQGVLQQGPLGLHEDPKGVALTSPQGSVF